MDTRLILARLYRQERRPTRWRRMVKTARRRVGTWIEDRTTHLVFGALLFGVWGLGHFWYYNQLTTLEFNAKVGWAQVEAAQQRRNHVQRNLVRLVNFYADYERSTMKDLTILRTEESKPDSSAGASPPGALLGRLDAVAENYPNLNLGASVQLLSQAVLDSETDVANSIKAYNLAVNQYTTVLHQFPGRLFGQPMGFETMAFYTPVDQSILDYKELSP